MMSSLTKSSWALKWDVQEVISTVQQHHIAGHQTGIMDKHVDDPVAGSRNLRDDHVMPDSVLVATCPPAPLFA
ncbi:hypothetical protein WJ36_20090 [Burkholderia ubonensis]|nr:hypothetical protein WJ36_20090 [Burkholderia ubonensis]